MTGMCAHPSWFARRLTQTIDCRKERPGSGQDVLMILFSTTLYLFDVNLIVPAQLKAAGLPYMINLSSQVVVPPSSCLLCVRIGHVPC